MINPQILINEIIKHLRDTPQVLRHLDHDPSRVASYVDAPPAKSSLSREIFQMRVPSLLVAYMGTNPDQDEKIFHSVSIYIRANDSDNPEVSSFASLITDIYNAVPTQAGGQNLFSLVLTNDVEPMTIPAAQRIHDEEGSIDIFELVTRIQETWANNNFQS